MYSYITTYYHCHRPLPPPPPSRFSACPPPPPAWTDPAEALALGLLALHDPSLSRRHPISRVRMDGGTAVPTTIKQADLPLRWRPASLVTRVACLVRASMPLRTRMDSVNLSRCPYDYIHQSRQKFIFIFNII